MTDATGAGTAARPGLPDQWDHADAPGRLGRWGHVDVPVQWVRWDQPDQWDLLVWMA